MATMLSGIDLQPERDREHDHDRRLDHQDRRRRAATGPGASDARLIGVTRIRSTTPLRSSAMSPKPPNAVPKIAIWMISPGTNQLNAFVPVPADCTAPFEQRPEQDEIEDRHHHPEDDPDRLAEGQDERAPEDEPGVADESSCRVFLS